MIRTTIFFHSNLRFLRQRKKQTQEELAKALGLMRAKLQPLESGAVKNPSVEDLLRFSDYFRISVDSLLRIDLSKLSELKLRELEAGNDVYMTGTNMRVLAITVNEANSENVEYVPVKAKAGYRNGYADPEFLATLPRFSLPNLPGGTHRIFPITGDSMLPVPEGSDVVTRYVEDWKTLKPGAPCIVILKGEQDFVFKMVTVKEESLLLKSLNPDYEPYEVAIEDVLEIWEFHSYSTRTFPDPQTDLQSLTRAVRDIRETLNDMKKNR